ncbi:MAG: muconolactone Delta-isomerase family protein [Candidatus Methylacidiphilales bacterium]
MVEIKLPFEIDNNFMRKIPSHRAFIGVLINKGKIQSYTINEERTNGWIIFNTESEAETETIVQQLPLYEFITYKIHAVMVHDSEMFRFPKMHMN